MSRVDQAVSAVAATISAAVSASDAARITKAAGRYGFANDATVRAFQTSREELYGKTDEQILDADTAAQLGLNDKKAIASETGLIAVETLKHDGGVLHHSLVSKFAIRDLDGAAKATGGVAINIAERVQAKKRLREATEKLIEADRRKATAM